MEGVAIGRDDQGASGASGAYADIYSISTYANISCQLFVVKDTWRDDERCPEGELYQHIGRADGIAILRSFSQVCINGEDDTVTSRIRRKLPVRGKPRYVNATQPMDDPSPPYPVTLSTTSPDRCHEHAINHPSPRDYLPVYDVADFSPRGKTHSRIVLESYGWPIQYAKSLLELVGAARDALQGR